MGFGDLLRSRVSARAALAIGAGLAGAGFVLLAVAGLPVVPAAMIALLTLGASVMIVVVNARRYPARTEHVQETVLLDAEPERAWNLIEAADMAPLLDPRVRRGTVVEGTPEGVGQQQRFEHLDGTIIVIEVTGYDPGRSATTRCVSPDVAPGMTQTESIEALDDGCLYRVEVAIPIAAGTRLNPEFENEWRSTQRDRFRRIRDTLGLPPSTG